MGVRIISYAFLIFFIFIPSLVLSGGGKAMTETVTRSEMEELKARLERLEKIVASQQKIIEQQKKIIKEQEEKISSAEIKEPVVKSDEESHPSWSDKIHIGGLIEVGAGWKNSESQTGKHEAESDITLTTVEIHIGADVTNWINIETVLLYEDALFGDDDHDNFDVDTGVLTIGNTDKFPLYASIGKMYVPFGALLTHFPDDPFTDIPLTLLLGETNEKAILVGFEKWGLSASAYVFNGEFEKGEEDHIKDYGFDLHYKGRFVPGGHVTYGRGEKYIHEAESGFDYLIGFSFISNIAESDGLTEMIEDNLGSDKIHKSIPGIDGYFHIEYKGIFFDAEYMGALETFSKKELSYRLHGAKPKVWNFETGFNYNWWRNLEVAFKYAGSDDAPEFPKYRFGICFNQEIYDSVIASLGYIHDEYSNYSPDVDPDEVLNKKDFFFWQLAAEF